MSRQVEIDAVGLTAFGRRGLPLHTPLRTALGLARRADVMPTSRPLLACSVGTEGTAHILPSQYVSWFPPM